MSKSRRYVLLDRDGTLNVEKNYLSDPAQIELLPGVIEGLKLLESRGFGTVILTNQSGISRGYFDKRQLENIHRRLRNLLFVEGITIHGIYYCPHSPNDHCSCRKPQPGLVYRAAAELKFDPFESFVIGDKPSDIEMGRRVRATTVLVPCKGYEAEDEIEGAEPDFVARDLVEAATLILQLVQQPRGQSPAVELGSIRRKIPG